MIIRLPYRAIFFGIAVFCFAVVGYALYLQFGPDKQQPCPLCILQRYGYLLIGFVALIAALHGPRTRAARYYAGATGVLASGGIGLAIWQLTKGASMTSCLSDPIGEFVNGLPMSAWWDGQLFFATGGCADKFPPVFGLSVPVWSLICFTLVAVLAGLMLRRARTKAN